jgi:hypothetical protein
MRKRDLLTTLDRRCEAYVNILGLVDITVRLKPIAKALTYNDQELPPAYVDHLLAELERASIRLALAKSLVATL